MTSQVANADITARKKKLEKKLLKLRDLGDAADAGAVAKLARKLAKLTKTAVADTSSTPGSGQSEDSMLVLPVGADASNPGKVKSKKRASDTNDEPAGKKAKRQQQQQQQGPSNKQATPQQQRQPLAVVGDVSLATSRPPIVRSLYSPHPAVAALSAAEVAALREERRTTLVGGEDAAPLTSFEQTGLSPQLLHSVRDFTAPSPIQAQCWPVLLSGHDLIGIAATGSGKTLGFGLPMLAHILAQRDSSSAAAGRKGAAAATSYKRAGPGALVLAPTRELALQIAAVLTDAGSKAGVTCTCVYGGVPKGPQVAALRAGVDVVVGTPGRLEDLMQDGVCRLQDVTYLVLDEADRMLDLGFEPHIRAICSQIRADRLTAMFSATWPTAVQQLAAAYLSSPARVTVGSAELAASHSVTQRVEVLEGSAREARLLALLAKHHADRSSRIIIFVLYKKEAPRLEATLTRRGWRAAAIHGDISQAQRTAAVEGFKAGTTPLLIATDVAARGLDIPDVEVVINFSFPLTIEDYVHRIGRTGRAGKRGTAITFFVPGNDKQRAGELINVLREAKQDVPSDLLAFGTTVKKKEHKLYGAHFKDVDLSKKASKITFDD